MQLPALGISATTDTASVDALVIPVGATREWQHDLTAIRPAVNSFKIIEKHAGDTILRISSQRALNREKLLVGKRARGKIRKRQDKERNAMRALQIMEPGVLPTTSGTAGLLGRCYEGNAQDVKDWRVYVKWAFNNGVPFFAVNTGASLSFPDATHIPLVNLRVVFDFLAYVLRERTRKTIDAFRTACNNAYDGFGLCKPWQGTMFKRLNKAYKQAFALMNDPSITMDNRLRKVRSALPVEMLEDFVEHAEMLLGELQAEGETNHELSLCSRWFALWGVMLLGCLRASSSAFEKADQVSFSSSSMRIRISHLKTDLTTTLTNPTEVVVPRPGDPLHWRARLMKYIEQIHCSDWAASQPFPHSNGICMGHTWKEMSGEVNLRMEEYLTGDLASSLPEDVVILSHSWRMSAACIAHHAGAHVGRGLCVLGMWKIMRAGKKQALEYVEEGYEVIPGMAGLGHQMFDWVVAR
jgi:hypothetical protein